MKSVLSRIIIVGLVLFSPFAWAEAGKSEDAPGIQKKVPPLISDVSVAVSNGTATITWQTSVPTFGSVIVFSEFDAVGYPDLKFGTRHEVTVQRTAGDEFLIESHSDKYGAAAPWEGTL